MAQYIDRPDAKVLLDSVSPNGDRLTTMQVTMHRFVLAEFNIVLTYDLLNDNIFP